MGEREGDGGELRSTGRSGCAALTVFVVCGPGWRALGRSRAGQRSRSMSVGRFVGYLSCVDLSFFSVYMV